MNPNEPLGLPRGSVRALLAIIVTVGCMAYFFIHNEFPTEVVAIMTLVILYYFQKRASDDIVSPPAFVEPALPDPYVEDGE